MNVALAPRNPLLGRKFELRVHAPGVVTRHPYACAPCLHAQAAQLTGQTGSNQVATVNTPLTYAQALGALQAVMPNATWAGVVMAAAQSAVETAHWTSMHNYNFGNVTPTTAQVNAGTPWMDQGISGMKYISYPDPISGAQGMVGWLQGHGLLTAANNGDLASYMVGLENGSYLGTIGLTDPTGHTVSQTDYDNYQAGIQTWMNNLQNVTPVAPPMPGSGLLSGLGSFGKGAAAVLGGAAAVVGGVVLFDRFGPGVLRAIARAA